MAETMKAAVLREFGAPLQIEELPRPEPGHGQIVVKVSACGVCHSDVHAVDGDWPGKPRLPLIPGHEVTGFVAAVGPGVKRFKEGDRAGVPWIYSACGGCENCLTGWENMCRSMQSTGYLVAGGFAEYILAEADYAAAIPDGLPLDQAAPLLCAGLTSYKGIKETGARPGEWVVISGVGGLGHLGIEYAKALGLHVVAVDVSDEKLALAKQLGADLTINAIDEDAPKVVRKAIGGAHGVVVTAASTQAYAQALNMLRSRGTLIMCSMPNGDLAVPIISTIGRGITIRGSAVGSRKDLQEALQFGAEGKVTAHISSRPLDAVNSVLDELRRGEVQGRVVLHVG